MQFPLLARTAIVFGIAIAILLPIDMIRGKVSERRARAEQVARDFAVETSGPQVIAGPFIALTCEETFNEERQVMRAGKAETVAERKVGPCPTVFVPPRTLRVDGSMPVERRHRGIYEIRLFRASLEIAGEFDWPAPARANGLNTRVYKKAYLVMGVGDARGIKSITSGTAGASTAAEADAAFQQFAIREPLGDYAPREAGSKLPFQFRADILGTSSLHVSPVGDATQITLRSDWPHPAFSKSWSPDERKIGAEGFEARWRTTSVSTGGEDRWNRLAHSGKLLQAENAVGVLLFDPVNVYALSYRATEYAFLFILFTFAALALMEAVTEVRLHAVQYALVGTALAVFFLLLLSLSEHLAFPIAYAIAASACVLLLTIYLRHPLGSATRTAVFSGLFASVYGSLYVLLRSEDHALLMGSVMVFGVLALLMLATRKLDWAQVTARMVAKAP